MPEGAAELAVGDGLKPVVRLLSDEAGDFRVLDGGQLLAGDFPRVKEAAGVDDTERAGDFTPLRHIADQTVVLGLISSKVGTLEDPEAIKARIREAAQYVPMERLCLSTQCGFSSTEEGNLLTEDDEWAKVRLVVKIAREMWADA